MNMTPTTEITDETKATYKVAHLACTLEKLKRGIRYIVTRTDQKIHRLFADERCAYHGEIEEAMRTAGKLLAGEQVIGGGHMLIRESSGSRTLDLYGRSRVFGGEPQEIRDAFRPLLIEKLRSMGIETT